MLYFFDLEDTQPLILESKNNTNVIRASISAGGAYTYVLETISSEIATRNLFITSEPGICQGEPVITGTRISVVNIVELYYWLGWDISRIKSEYPYLTEQQIIAALEYYRDHVSEIDASVEEERRIDGN